MKVDSSTELLPGLPGQRFSTGELDSLRRRSTRTLFGSVALGTTALYAAFTVSPLVAAELTGSVSWSGAPGAAAVLGAGLGAAVISRLMVRRGRRPGLVVGYATAVVGAVLAALAFDAGSFPLLLVGMLLVGIGHGASQLSRFIAADLRPTARRSSGVALIVWASTVGAASGPALLQPMRAAATSLGLPPLAGGFLIAVAGFSVAAVICAVLLRPDPQAIAVEDTLEEMESGAGDAGSAWKLPVVRTAVIVIIVSQVAMVLVMTMTPLHMRSFGHALGAIGFVMSSHFVGMFALAPVAGRLADRLGAIPMALLGLGILAGAALLAAAAPGSAHVLVALSLFLLGLGWCFAFVSGSSLIAAGLPYAVRVRMQGNIDTLTWSVAALASLSSGVLIDVLNFPALCVIAASLAAGAALVIAAQQRPAAAALESPASA